MRKLNTSDVFALARVVRASGMREDLTALIKWGVESDAKLEDIGITGVLTVLEALAERKAESAIYEVLAGPLEMEPKAVADMPLDNLAPMLQTLWTENNLKDFLSWVSGILGRK